MINYPSTVIATDRPNVNLNFIKSLFELHVDRELLEGYRLPVRSNDITVVVGMSGGADSTVLGLYAAAYLAPRYANIEFVFTDTEAEPESCYETLDSVDAITNTKITRLLPKRGLFELINQYNGFLPNSRARWCTRELKIETLKEYMSQCQNDREIISLAGIRYDEADRDGISFQYTMENTSAAFPFIDLKITKEMVFDILQKSIGIPSTYAYRSRSGCYACFFQRNQEIIGMLFNNPQHFAKTESYEKLTEEDRARWQVPVTLAERGIKGYYPIPAFVDIRKPDVAPQLPPIQPKAKKDSATVDMFSTAEAEVPKQSLFAAFALYTDSALNWFGGRQFTPGVYWQEFITVSTSLRGLKSALGNYFTFKMTTLMPHYDPKDLKIVIAQIDFPEGVLDTNKPSKESFTWKSGTSYAQLRHLAMNCQTSLEAKDLQRRYDEAVSSMRSATSLLKAKDAAAEVLSLKRLIDKTSAPGVVAWEGIYTPSAPVQRTVQLQLAGVSVNTKRTKAREGLEFDEVPMACISCSI